MPQGSGHFTETAAVGDTQLGTGDDHFLPFLEPGVAGMDHGAGQVDSGDQRVRFQDSSVGNPGETILVVHSGPSDTNCDLPGGSHPVSSL